VVASDVEPEQAREVRDLSIPGVTVTPDAVRVYPNGTLMSQLLGHLGEDEAYGGVEARYDETLKRGEDVTLTIDTAVQEELDAALIAAADEHGAASALGLVMRRGGRRRRGDVERTWLRQQPLR
jgi:cell division protein FtsI/penicillin-binding protein 2